MKYVISCFVFVVGFLPFNSLLGVDLQNDLARLDIELSSLSKMIPTGKRPLPKTPKKPESSKQSFFGGVKKGLGDAFEGAKKWTGFGKDVSEEIIKEVSFDDAKKWPDGTKIKISGAFYDINTQDAKEFIKDSDSVIPLGTEVRVPGPGYVVKIGNLDYQKWKYAGFPRSSKIKKEDYKEFPPNTEIKIGSHPLIIMQNEGIIPNQEQYVDDEYDLIGVTRIDEYNFNFISLDGFDQALDQIKEG